MLLGEILFILVLFVLPVFLLREHVIPHKYRFFIIDAVAIIVVTYLIIQGWSLEKLGISFKTIQEYSRPYLIIALSSLVVLLISARKMFNIEQIPSKTIFKINPVFAITSIVQEVLFRSFLLTYQLQIGMDFILAIITNALLFMFMHMIYATDIKILVFIFLSGILFASTYFFFPNLILISLLHIFFNHIVVVLFGVFRTESRTPKKRIFPLRKKQIKI